MSKTKLRFVVYFRDFKTDLVPFHAVLSAVKLNVVQNEPNHSFTGDRFGYFHLAKRHVLVVTRELGAEFVGGTLDFS